MSYCTHCGGQVPDGAAFCPSCGKPPAGSVATAEKRSSKTLFWVLGCALLAVVLAVAGIVAAIVVPNFLGALEKAKQTRAMVELQTMGQAIEVYKAEHGYAPRAADVAGLAAALGDRYASSIPRLDPWQHPFRYLCWKESRTAEGCDHYRIACAGRDGKFEKLDLRAYEPAEFASTEYDRDMVYGDGAFIVQPRRQ
jgi:hypothetical protein